MDGKPAVTPGYQIGRDDDGMTARERRVLFLIREGHSGSEIARRMDLTKQRVGQIRNVLEAKGKIRKEGTRIWVAVK